MNLPDSADWQNDADLFSLAKRELFTAVVGDIMDGLGLRHQFLPPEIRPLRPAMVLIGRAMTVKSMDIPADETASEQPKPFGLMLDALDDLNAGEIYLCAGSSPNYALWGELMTVRALRCGAAGAILDGYLRDTGGIAALDFPAFSRGSYAQDQAPRGRVVDFRVPLRVGAVDIAPGDVLFGDIDGVCAVPRHAEREVFAMALEKARGEKTVRRAIESGVTAKAAFEKYGIM